MKFKNLIIATIVSLALTACDSNDTKSPTTNANLQNQSKSAQPVSSEEAIKNNIEKGTFHFSTGKHTEDYTKKLFIFFDPQCVHCSNLWKNLQDESLKDINVIWIPVAVLNEKSAPQSASLLSAKEPVVLFDEHERLMSQNKVNEANLKLAEIAKNNSKQSETELGQNTKIFMSTGATGVPLVLKLSNDKQKVLGAPGELSVSLLNDLVKEQNQFAPKK